MIQDETILELRKLLDEAVAGRLSAFVALAIFDDQLVTQICDVPELNAVTMIGLTALMNRDVLSLCPAWDLGPDDDAADKVMDQIRDGSATFIAGIDPRTGEYGEVE